MGSGIGTALPNLPNFLANPLKLNPAAFSISRLTILPVKVALNMGLFPTPTPSTLVSI